MNKKFNGTIVETSGVRSIAGGGTGSTTAPNALTALGAVASVPTDTTPVNAIRAITQAEYDAISPKNDNTIYFIKQ